MATAYGNVVQHWQAYVDAYIVAQDDKTATVRCRSYFHSIRWGYQVYGNGTATVNGQSANSGRQMCRAGRGQTVTQLLATKDVRVSKRTSGFYVPCSATVQLTGGYHNGTSRASVNVWVPAIPYLAPDAPTGLAVERLSDTAQRLTWKNAVSDKKPVNGTGVYCSVDDSSSYTALYSGASCESYTNGSTQPGHKYTYYVRSRGAGGTGAASAAVSVYTSPLAFASLAVSRTSAGVRITPSGLPRYMDGVEGQVTTDGATWKAVSLTKDGDDYVDSAPLAGTVVYRLRATIGCLAGAWAQTDPLVTVCAPYAPLVDVPTVAPTGTSLRIAWTPNHPDWSAQTAAQVEVTAPGATEATVTDVSGATAFLLVDEPVRGTYSIRVRTKGAYEGWGAWSAVAAVSVEVPPAVSITSPADSGTIDRLPLTVTWRSSDATGIVGQTVRVYDASGAVIAEKVAGLVAVSAEFGGEVGFENETAYSVEVEVRGGSGLKTSALAAFSTEWAHPDAPSVNVRYGADMSAQVDVVSAETGIAAVSFDVVRLLADGSKRVLATGLKTEQSALDRMPPLNTAYWYMVTAYAETGAALTVKHEAVCPYDGVAFNFGADASVGWYAPLRSSFTRKKSREVDLYHFADGGANGSLPMAYALDEKETADSYKLRIVGREDFETVNAISEQYWQGWVRDPWGGIAYCYVDLATIAHKGADVWDVTANVQRLVWREPNDA